MTMTDPLHVKPRANHAWLLLAAGFAAATGIVLAQTPPMTREARAMLMDSSGKRVGMATFTDNGSSTKIVVEVSGLTPGQHGAHVHSKGECAAGPDDQTGEIIPFGKTGGHFDPFATRNHGAPTDALQQAHAGVLPNITVDANGSGRLEFDTPKLTVRPGKLIISNRAIVIHEKLDDYATDPSGNSGSRLVCGVILENSQTLLARYPLPDSNAFPEGIVFDSVRNAFYTGSSSNGTIYRVTLGSDNVDVLALGGSPGRGSALGMKLDSRRRLIVAGGAQGAVAVVNTSDGQTFAVRRAVGVAAGEQTFVNDLTITGGYAYVTDSFRPVLMRMRVNGDNYGPLENWLDLRSTPVRYADGINLNGIVSSADGRWLLSVQTNTGKLFRIDTRSRAVREVNLGGVNLKNGDGLVLSGRTLYVVLNATSRIDVMTLAADYSSARVTGHIDEPNLRFPTTAALAGGRMLVVNGQLDQQGESPVLPFTISSLSLTPNPATR
jgi:superoxide dismutase, Cu-Zn family